MSYYLFVYTNGNVDDLNFNGVRALLGQMGDEAEKMDLCLTGIPNIRGIGDRMDWSTLFEPGSLHYRQRADDIRAHLEEQAPGILVVCQDWHPLSRQPVLVARELGIATVCLLGEGFFIEESEYYWGEVPIVDFMLVWGNLHREVFTRRGYPADRIRVTGPPRMDHYAHFRPTITREELLERLDVAPSSGKRIVTFATQPFGDQGPVERLNMGKRRSLELLAQAAREQGFLVVVKVHPLEDGNNSCVDYAAFQAENQDCVGVLNVGPHQESIDIHTMIHYSDAWCAFSSSTLLEARLMGRPAIELNLTSLPSVVGLGEHGVCYYATSAEELNRWLKASLSGGDSASPGGLQWALDRWFPGRFDGLNTERVAQALLEIGVGIWRPSSDLPPATPPRILPSLVCSAETERHSSEPVQVP